MAARKSSLRDLAFKAKSEKLAAANPQPVANRVVELDPALVHAGGIADRIEIDAVEIERLSESIRQAGQKVPILVRPHPEKPGEYQIVAGRRRLAACKHAGLPVRAEIQDLDERDLILGQAIENIAREDLSYIERARLAARMVDEAGLQPADIDMAFSCGKTDRSRYLKIGRGIPSDIAQWIGKAPSAGRPRWEQLVGVLEADEAAETRVREVLAAANTEDRPATSDDRFNRVYQAATEVAKAERTKPQKPEVYDIYVDGVEKPIARMKETAKGVELTLTGERTAGFLAWVAAHREEIVEQIIRNHEREARGDEPTELMGR